jgi:hypothetical protein
MRRGKACKRMVDHQQIKALGELLDRKIGELLQ